MIKKKIEIRLKLLERKIKEDIKLLDKKKWLAWKVQRIYWTRV
jgi:hypothetical protein